MNLNTKQQEALSLMEKGENVFITGLAGSGKTTCIKAYIKLYKHVKKIGITSTTGVSAIMFNGVTLHSFLGIGLGNSSVDQMVNKIFSRKYLSERWKTLQVLIIDEISMLTPDLFDKLEEVARVIRRNPRPFGGIQLIISGDFLQLPPVKSNDFCFMTIAWDSCIKKVIYLTEIVRQKEIEFQECLNEVRVGILSDKSKALLKSRIGIKLTNEYNILPTVLYATNKAVDEINQKEMDSFIEKDADFYSYDIDVKYINKKKKLLIDNYSKFCPARQTLELCIGCQVMLTYNLDQERGLINGSRGIVIDFKNDIPLVKFLNGVEILIDFHEWNVEENDIIVGKIIQIPLKIAYALTIHCSQGCSLDYCTADLTDVFEYGQAYVCLSRVKSINGLSLIGIDFSKIKANPLCIEYYNTLENKIE